jgi:hypothetical protein
VGVAFAPAFNGLVRRYSTRPRRSGHDPLHESGSFIRNTFTALPGIDHGVSILGRVSILKGLNSKQMPDVLSLVSLAVSPAMRPVDQECQRL